MSATTVCVLTIYFKISMNALQSLQHAQPTPHVSTLMEVTHAHAILDTLEMGFQCAMV